MTGRSGTSNRGVRPRWQQVSEQVSEQVVTRTSKAVSRMSKDGSVSDRAMGTSNADGQGELDCAMNDMKIYI